MIDIQKLAGDAKQLLSDLDFPAQKNEVVNHAQQNGASPDTVDTLQKLPDQKFNGVDDIIQKLPMNNIAEDIDKFL